MLALAADENFNNDIVRGLRRRATDLDIVRIQDVGLAAADDPTVLEWAAQEGRDQGCHRGYPARGRGQHRGRMGRSGSVSSPEVSNKR